MEKYYIEGIPNLLTQDIEKTNNVENRGEESEIPKIDTKGKIPMKKAGTSIIILSIVFFIINVATMNNRVDSNSNSLYGIIIFFLASLFWALIGGIFYMIASVKDGNTFKKPLAYLKKLDPAIDRSWEKALIREGSAYVKQHKHEPNVAWHAIYEAALKIQAAPQSYRIENYQESVCQKILEEAENQVQAFQNGDQSSAAGSVDQPNPAPSAIVSTTNLDAPDFHAGETINNAADTISAPVSPIPTDCQPKPETQKKKIKICPKCKAEFDYSRKYCPQCDRRLKKPRRLKVSIIVSILVAVFLLGSVIGIFVYADNQKKQLYSDFCLELITMRYDVKDAADKVEAARGWDGDDAASRALSGMQERYNYFVRFQVANQKLFDEDMEEHVDQLTDSMQEVMSSLAQLNRSITKNNVEKALTEIDDLINEVNYIMPYYYQYYAGG